jgi:ribosomal protein S18 acetylase RimI-like enzyme
MTELRVWRAGERDRDTAYQLVEEYNEAVGVLLRDSPESFQNDYFTAGTGLWLAQAGGDVVGCIALRRLSSVEHAGEIKRMYVRPEFRGRGVALALLVALEEYAAASGYRWLYLDSKDDLQSAIRFYDRHGYQPCDRYNANAQATIFLRKELQGHAERVHRIG